MTTARLFRNLKIFGRLLSDESLTQKAYMNALAAALDYGARLVTGFLVTPFLVAGLGDVLYGVWRTVGNLTGYISAASGRPSQALKWTTARLQSSTDYEQKRRNVGSALVVWLLFFPLLTTLSGVVAWFAPLLIRDLPADLFGIVRLAAGLLMADMILTTLTVLPQSVLEGENLGYKRMGLSVMLVFVGGGLAVLALYLQTGLVGVAVAELATTLLTGLFFWVIVSRYVPWFGFARPTKQMVRDFFGLSGWFLIWRLVIQLMTASDLIILGVFASAGLVTTYSLTKYAPEMLINLVAIVVLGGSPGLGGIIGSGDLKKAARVRGELMLLTWLVTVVIGTTILLWNQSFIQLWVGEARYAGSEPNLLILILIAQFVLIKNDANIIDLTLNLSRKVILGFISALLSIGGAAILVGVFHAGITGLILGLLAGRSILSLAYPFLIGRFLGRSLYNQMRSAVRPLLVSVLLVGAALQLDSWLHSDRALAITWVSLCIYVGLTVGIVGILAFNLGFTRDQQKRTLHRLRMVIPIASPRTPLS
jgi:O-antigen/teichoic acid export membrane protein